MTASHLNAPQLNITGQRATITLSRPDEHNRIDPSDIPHLMRLLDEIEAHPSVRVLVITGSGLKTFSSGYTIAAILKELDSSFEALLDRLEQFALPTLCALNGSAYGGGTDLAMCCDFRIGVSGSRMFIPAARFGLHYYPGGIRRFTRQLGPSAAKKIFLTCLPIHDQEMLRIGFLNELVHPSELSSAVDRYVLALCESEKSVTQSMKQHIDSISAGNADALIGVNEYKKSLQSPELAGRLSALSK
jgi:enoyl-CoA hydratase/carnithine racemase